MLPSRGEAQLEADWELTDTERTEESSKQGTGHAKALWLERPGQHEGLEDAYLVGLQ